MRKPRIVHLASLMVAMGALLCFNANLRASVTARVSGTVKDPKGSVVPRVKVAILNEETGIRETTVTDAQGFYSFPSLPVGRYDLEVSHPGFRNYRQVGLILTVNDVQQVDVTLEMGEVNQQVTVRSSELRLDTTSTQMGEVIGSDKMTSVPLNGRSYTDLLALQPGVSPVTSGQYNTLPASGDLNAGSLSISGGRESANAFMVNGGNVEEPTYMATAVIPNLDSIAEFRILTNNVDAEYGNYSGGQVNVITKSGTDRFHGDAFDFLRNTDLDARNYFSPTRGKYVQNQFGGTGGGPVLRNRLFFFGDYQGTRLILGQSTGLVPVPSAADHSGNLSDIASLLTGTVTGGYWASLLSQESGYTVTEGEPYYKPGCVSNTQCVFPNAMIPPSMITAVSTNMKKYIPLPNDGAYFTTASDNETLSDDKGGIRLDGGSADARAGLISVYYFIDNFNESLPYLSASFPGFAATTEGRAQMVNASDIKAFGPSLVNELRANYTRYSVFVGKPSQGLTSLASLGFAPPSQGGIYPLLPQFEGVPPTSFNNYSMGVPGGTLAQTNNSYQLLDNLSKTIGTHAVKFGFDTHDDRLAFYTYQQDNGAFVFNGQETGSDFADFLIGAPTSFSQGQEYPMHERTYYLGIYAQDSWRASSDLVLNYGLRWDLTIPWIEENNEIETLVPGVQSTTFPNAPTGWLFPGDPGIARGLAPIRFKNFAPRVGIAYSPSNREGFAKRLLGAAGATSIKAGFGIFYTAYEDATGFNEVGDAPYGNFYVNPVPPLFGTPYIDRQTGNNEGERFPVAPPPPNVSPQHPDSSIDWSNFTPISSSAGFWYKNQVPYTEEYNLTVQRQIGGSNIVSVSYVGSQGHHLLSDMEANPGNPALCLEASSPSQVAPNSPTCGPNGENGVYTLVNGTVINGTRAPFGNNFGSNGYFIAAGNSNYNALEATWRYSGRSLNFLAGYTYSKSIDDSSGWGDQINFFNPRLSRALSSFDVPQDFVVSYYYAPPLDHLTGNDLLKLMVGGWELSGITRFASGLPVTLSESDDNSLLGTGSTGPNGASLDVPNYAPGNLAFTNPRSGKPYFNTSLFSPEALGQLGNSKYRFFSGPGINDFDTALLKNVRIKERATVQLRFEFFNAFNHTQFNHVNGNIDGGPTSFGFVTSARDPRIGQVAIKILF